MSRIVHESNSGFLPAGIHTVKVTSIEDAENTIDPNKPTFQIHLQSTEEIDGQFRTARFWTSPVLHSKGKLKPFSEAVLGRNLTSEETRNGFDVDTLIGKQVCVVIRDAVSKTGNQYAKVVDFLPVKQS